MSEFINQIKNMKKDRLVIWILCFLFIIMGFFMLLGLKDAEQCLANPFVYGAESITSDKTGNVHCSCNFESPNYAPFYFDNDSLEIGENPLLGLG